MQIFGEDYVDRLNRQYDKGKFLKAVRLNETPGLDSYWVDHEEPIDFEGHTYKPLHMFWDKIKTSGSMPTDGPEVALSNVGNQVVKYLKTMDVTGNVIYLQLIHLDLLASLSPNYWKRKLKIMSVKADINAAVFTLGRYLGRNRLPRRVILSDEYPGVNSDVARIF